MAPSDFRGFGCLCRCSFTQKFYPQQHHFLSAIVFHYRDALGGVTSKRISSMFQTAKAQGVRREKKKKKTGQSFESVSDRLGQLSVYINKLEF